MTSYEEFLEKRAQQHQGTGFDPTFLPEWLFPFQRHLVKWAVKMGRAAIFADCGLGKTPMQLVWAENVRQRSNKPVLIVTPLAVSIQTQQEAEKFGLSVFRSQDGSHDDGLVVTNYERLHYFDRHQFGGVVCDESSILKNHSGKTRKAVTEFLREIPYRLLCTATAAPNDYHELGTSSDALGHLGYRDMLTMFFKEETKKDYLGWGRKAYRFRGHAEEPFWRWVCSWARSCRRPSDLGFDDSDFELPGLEEREMVVETGKARDGMLFSLSAQDLREQREERRLTMDERCEAAAEIAIGHDGASVLWCHLNEEGKRLSGLLPDALEVSGSMPDEEKERRLIAFQRGEVSQLVTKPKIGCYGLNWQHCHNVVTFPSHSWEQYYQEVRRCLRFGQTHTVKVTTVTTEGEIGVLANLQRKADQAERMFESLVSAMGKELRIERDTYTGVKEALPSWL